MGILDKISNINGWVSQKSLYAILRNTLLLAPVFLAIIFGCQKLEYESNFKKSSEVKKEERLDAFIYEDDSLMRLDAYNIFNQLEGSFGLDSRAGNKRVILLGNSPIKDYEWYQIQSYSSIKELYHDIENEDINHPFSNSILKLYAGGKGKIDVKLRPFLSKILIRSICCDFAEKTYKEARLEDVKIYLTNINARVYFTQEEFSHPVRFVNQGRLNDWTQSHNIHHIDKVCLYPEVELFCFPNTCAQEGVGTPFTRLVIEGNINGQTYYYPININRNPGNGVERNQEYIYDITITQAGTSHPDIPIEKDAIQVTLNIAKWKDKEEYEIPF